ncbi:twin-arginine translocation pathway signal protein [Pararhodospirillum oryzae]|uniref:Twin-arginine translocation pathway signal protein n=1 Tax=Pararhodospirillum oryzae TaxID=478448 RepID=A0A512H5V1_9PROT|nr:twin-arginine translocation pathway signal protein [Pararhodospirillum oryzae]GEO80823.1 twin-arginine translocation pathway signal protein [Pararhodospirillum oryzae]
MSPVLSRRRAGVSLALGALGLAGCGFRSALADRPGPGGTASVPALLGLIYVHRVESGGDDDTRLAQALRNALLDRMGLPDRPAFGLAISVRRALTGSGINLAGKITHQTLTANATFTLRALNQEGAEAPRDLVFGTESAWSSFDRLDSPFADRVAVRDLDDRVAHSLADQIYTRIAAYFVEVGGPTRRG